MAEDEKSLQDVFSEIRGQRPLTGAPGGDASTNIYLPNSTIAGDPRKNNAANVLPDYDSGRVGDFVVGGRGQNVVVPNSLTDLVRRYSVVSGASKMKGLTFTDWANAIAAGVGAYLGAPTDGSNAAMLAGSGIASSLIASTGKAGPVGGAIRGAWAIANAGKALTDAANAYRDEYLNQKVSSSLAFHIVDNEDGTQTAIIDPEKMEAAGYGSGRSVLEANDTSGTSVSLDGNGGVNVSVSATFANSDTYADIVKQLKEAFPDGLSEEEANEVVNDDTGATRLETIENYIIGAESQFYYRAQSIADFKRIAPGASEKALVEACDTQLVGAMRNKDLGGMKITIYNSENQKEEVNALEYFESINEKSKVERNDYMVRLGNRIASSDISDDEKVILQAQVNALYMASNSKDSGFKGMYQKGFLDSIADTGGIFTGVRLGSLFGVKPLESFQDNDFYRGVLTLGTSVARMKAMSKIANGLEKLERFGATKLGGAIGDNKVGNFLKNVNKYAPQDAPVNLANSKPGEFVGKTLTQWGFQATADLAYETGRAAVYGVAGEDFDFLEELKADMIIDAIMTYGPNAYVDLMNGDRYEYRKVGDEVKLVQLDADELAAKRAAQLNKLTDSDAALKTQEVLFDKNAAMNKLALQVRAAVGENRSFFRELINKFGDIRQNTKIELDKFRSMDGIKEHFDDFSKALNTVTENGSVKKFTKADADYINAAANKHRFSEIYKDDKAQKRKIAKFYEPALKGVSAERAAQLDDLMTSMRTIYADMFTYYKDRGLITSKEYERITESPGYANQMYFPVWSSKHKYISPEIGQTRKATKDLFDKEKLIPIGDFDNPLTTFAQYLNNQMRNIAVNERAKAIAEAAAIPGVDIRIVYDDGGMLREVKNLTKYNSDFKKVFDKIVADVNKEVPSHDEWQRDNEKAIMRSKAMGDVRKLDELQQEAKDLNNRLRRERRSHKKLIDNIGAPLKDGETFESRQEAIRKAEEDIDATRFEMAANKARQNDAISELWHHIETLMVARQRKNTWSSAKLDVKTYIEVNVVNNIKASIKTGDSLGKLQGVVNKAVEAANPYISREVIINNRSRAAAEAFRRKVAEQLKAEAKNNKTKLDKVNALADKITDYVTEKALGGKPKNNGEDGKYNPEDIASVLTTYDSANPRTIRYFLNGKEHRMTLTGKGAEQLVEEFYAPEFKNPTNMRQAVGQGILKAGSRLARSKRFFTSMADVARALPNLARDWTRGIVTTGGRILLSVDDLRRDAVESGRYSDAEIKKIEDGWELARRAISGSTFTQSLEVAKKNRPDAIIKAISAPTDGNAFTRFIWDFKNKSLMEKACTITDAAEEFTRKHAMDTAYYSELASATARGESVDEAIKSATEAAYFYGREATTNFFRRGTLISKVAEQVPYLSQKFATLESFKYAYLDDPIAVSNSLRTTVTAYAGLIAIALSNDESRKRYYLLTEYDRANNIIVPLANNLIITIPLDDTVAAFLTPYRRMIETLNGVDPEAFYLWGAEFLEALSPLDLSGFSEGDKFNVMRGFQKMGAEGLPTWVEPILENMQGYDFYYGTKIRIDSDYTEAYYDNPNPSAGELTTKSKNSTILAAIANATGIPQWKLQNIYNEYGGNVGQYFLNTLDKLVGATEESQGGKEFKDAIFKPFTGLDSDEAQNAFWNGIDQLNVEKAKLQKEIKGINNKIEASTGDEKANLINQRREKIRNYGVRVSDFLTQYMSAYELTGGLTKADANRVWYLYDIYGDSSSEGIYADDSVESYYNSKVRRSKNDRATNLAAESGIDKFIGPMGSYYETYGQKAFENSIYGEGTRVMGKIAKAFENTDKYDDSITKKKKDVQDKRRMAYLDKNYDLANKLAYDYDVEVLTRALPYLQEAGLEQSLNNKAVMDYLKSWVIVPDDEIVTAKGRYLPKLPEETERSEAFKKRFIKRMYGVIE